MKEEPKQIKCYCGHTIMCDCSPIEPKQETLEEAIEEYAEIYRCPATNNNEYCKHDIISAINFGAKWQQKRMYSEGVICKDCKEVISVDDINNHLFMKIKSGGLIHWNCETI